MPLFYFHVHDGQSWPDNYGTELPDRDEARSEAVKLAGVLLGEGPAAIWSGDEWKLDVVDESGHMLLRLRFTAEQFDPPVPSGS